VIAGSSSTPHVATTANVASPTVEGAPWLCAPAPLRAAHWSLLPLRSILDHAGNPPPAGCSWLLPQTDDGHHQIRIGHRSQMYTIILTPDGLSARGCQVAQVVTAENCVGIQIDDGLV
jgi:hypothetical protein